ncbi:hypothetical protein SAMN06265222_108181 [Neorhodopirellula lusitana]|uniref:Uncharacterized protein n=1 Tax=Neorhodopirellula lusitana TaxID=445327 RepID=A0ABY1QA84_9BACT|nr:hypothetical protein SAMN06265222_108181 [Neorhodopirellula lusitana]
MRDARCELRVASCELRVASCELRVASCELRVASCELTLGGIVWPDGSPQGVSPCSGKPSSPTQDPSTRLARVERLSSIVWDPTARRPQMIETTAVNRPLTPSSDCHLVHSIIPDRQKRSRTSGYAMWSRNDRHCTVRSLPFRQHCAANTVPTTADDRSRRSSSVKSTACGLIEICTASDKRSTPCHLKNACRRVCCY